MIRQLIREMLITEEVYGKQAVIYHNSRSPPKDFMRFLLNDDFKFGNVGGKSIGNGLHCTWDPNGIQTHYGSYIYKFKVNLYGFICYDRDIARLVYGEEISPADQAELLGLDPKLIDYLRYSNSYEGGISAIGRIKGFVSARRMVLVYDPSICIPVGYRKIDETSWKPLDKESIRQLYQDDVKSELSDPEVFDEKYSDIVKNSAFDRWDPKKHNKRLYDISFHSRSAVAKLQKMSFTGNVEVEETLDLSNTQVAKLPSGLKVKGLLDLRNTRITSLPAGLEAGVLDLRGTRVTSLPANLKVGILDLGGTQITSLPADLEVGHLKLGNSQVTEIPAGLEVMQLTLGNSRVTELPAGFEVGNLDLSNSQITALPADLKVRILKLSNSQVTELPAGLEVLRLDLSNSRVVSLPNGLKVHGDLVLSNTQIETLPSDIIVNGNIIATNTRITSLPSVSNQVAVPARRAKNVMPVITDDDIMDIFS